MRLLFMLLFVFTIGNSFAQPSATMSSGSSICVGSSSNAIIFYGNNGTAPYTFTYTINGGSPQTIVSSTSSIVLQTDTMLVGTYTYTITYVEDATLSGQSVSVSSSYTVNPLPLVIAGPPQNVCAGTSVTFTGNGDAISYSWSSGIVNGVPFIPAPGFYTFMLVGIDFNGCMNTDQVNLIVNNLPFVNAGPDQAVCDATPVTLTGSGAVSYSWNNGVSNGVAFLPASTNTYTVTGVDGNGCVNTDQVVVTVGSPVPPVSVTIDSAYCANGYVLVEAPSDGATYTINWSNGSTSFVNSNLPAGDYTYTMTNDLTSCEYSETVTVPVSIIPWECATISGSVYIDQDQNCSVSGTDMPVQYRLIRANPGEHLTFTDANGNYTLNLLPGTYTVEELFANESVGSSCTSSYNVELVNENDAITDIDFYDTVNSVLDASISIATTQIRPFFSANIFLNVSELNGFDFSGGADAWFTLPANIILTSFSVPFTTSNDTVYFEVNSPLTSVNYYGTLSTGALSVWSMVTFNAGVDTLAGETVLANNQSVYTTMVVASFDPNDKTMFLNGVQSDSTILLTDQSLEYLIRFQNTGNADAIDIHVMDTISESLDLNTFEMIATSHNCQVSFEDDRVIKFNFPEIHLIDSTTNEPESHGYIRYRIRQAQDNSVGTVINNTAYIYFDMNDAVITNTTYDEIIEPSNALDEMEIGSVSIYPNPGKGIFTVRSEEFINAVSVLSLDGKMIHAIQQDGINTLEIDLTSFTSGTYLLVLDVNGTKVVKRVIKED